MRRGGVALRPLRRAHTELDEAKAALAEVGLRIAAEKRALADLRANREAQLRSSSQVATAGQRLALSLTASQEIHRRLVRLTSSSDAIAALSATTGVSSPGATAASSPSSLRKAGAPPKAASDVKLTIGEFVSLLGAYADVPTDDANALFAAACTAAPVGQAPADAAEMMFLLFDVSQLGLRREDGLPGRPLVRLEEKVELREEPRVLQRPALVDEALLVGRHFRWFLTLLLEF